MPPRPARWQRPRLEMWSRRRGLPVVGRRRGLTHGRQFNAPSDVMGCSTVSCASQRETNGRPAPRRARQPDRPTPAFDQPAADRLAQRSPRHRPSRISRRRQAAGPARRGPRRRSGRQRERRCAAWPARPALRSPRMSSAMSCVSRDFIAGPRRSPCEVCSEESQERSALMTGSGSAGPRARRRTAAGGSHSRPPAPAPR